MPTSPVPKSEATRGLRRVRRLRVLDLLIRQRDLQDVSEAQHLPDVPRAERSLQQRPGGSGRPEKQERTGKKMEMHGI